VTASIEAKGLQQPLCLGVDADGGVYLTDGHHRAIALMNLRVRRVDCDGHHEDDVEVVCDKPGPLATSPDAMVVTFAA
ncbi:ParB N-terminal domain-containing protein, partial [Streptomyces sp. A73]|nr:ParB N-terminal domain-containing protein [Streptomyces sp. A73]